MPAGDGNSSNPAKRTTFRPPWVKDGPDPSPAASPASQWNLKSAKKRDSTSSSDSGDSNPIAGIQLRKVQTKEPEDFRDATDKENPLENIQLRKVNKREDRESFRKQKENNPLAGVQLRKTSVQTKEPQENGKEKEVFFKKPQLKPVPQREKSPPKKDYKLHDLPKLNSVADRKLPERKQSLLRKDSTLEELEIDKELPAKRNSVVRAESMRRLSQTPAPPPMPPPPPGMPGQASTKPLNEKQKAKIDQLKSRPKVRPDWTAMLKDIEGGRKLRHVECNDRSQPLLPEAKAQEHFLYASEKPNVHNELLKQIEGGIKLKRVKTNDRSKPMLEGLRKFRRQMTIEEQIQKSMSMASIPPEEITPDEVDEMDDIDKVRDDLQSTKQMLALELRNKEAQEMENKRLMARIANLEAELEKEKSKVKGSGTAASSNSHDEKVISTLKKEAEETRKNSIQLEKKYTDAMKQLDTTKLQLDDAKRKNVELEKKLQDVLAGKRLSITERQNSVIANGENSDFELEEDESSEESDGEDTEEKREKRMQKEVKQLATKLRNFKHKEDNAKKERIALKEIIKKNQADIKEEKKKYNQLKKEVDKMAALLKDVGEDEDEDDDDEEKDEEEDVEEEESEESSDDESETDSDDSDSERSQSEPEDAPPEKKKANLSARSKRHENILGALKKTNFMLKTNAERLQDDLNKQKEMTASLQEELDSVLSELG